MRAACGSLAAGRFMPFSKSASCESVLAQDFSDRCRVVRDHGRVSSVSGGDLGDRAHVHLMVIPTGLERGPCWSAQGDGVKTVVAESVVSELLESRHIDRPTEG